MENLLMPSNKELKPIKPSVIYRSPHNAYYTNASYYILCLQVWAENEVDNTASHGNKTRDICPIILGY